MRRCVSWFSVILLCGMFLTTAWAENAQIVYSFGKLELLREGSQTWEFLKKGTTLAESDLVRMPPISILRLRTAEGTTLPVFTGAREMTVGQFIAEGYRRLKHDHHYRVVDPLQGEASIDILPTGAPTQTRNLTAATTSGLSVDESSWQSLRDAIGQIPMEISRQAADWLAQLEPPEYGSRPVQIARDFYLHVFGSLEAPLTIAPVVRYGQLLQAANVSIQCLRSAEGHVLLLLDTQLPSNRSALLTVNSELIDSIEAHVWMPLQIDHPSTTFVEAWYRGAETYQRLRKSGGPDRPR